MLLVLLIMLLVLLDALGLSLYFPSFLTVCGGGSLLAIR